MKKSLGLYVHIPFCVKKCKYCDFHSYAVSGQDTDGYVELLLKELEMVGAASENYEVDTVYLGGGTPSVLNEGMVLKILDKIRQSFGVRPDAEITMEVNPGTVSLRSLKGYRAGGVNRLSMGVQALTDQELERLGRIHSVRDFLESYAEAKVAGFDNLNLDLMFALPFQTLKQWKDTLEHVVKFDAKHLSLYGLQLEEGTELYKHRAQYKFADDEMDREMYHLACGILQKNGYEHYEISNFCKNGYESKHNLRYWELKEYYGIGSGASSFYKGVRFENPKGEEYKRQIESGTLSATAEKPDMEERMSEFMFLGLRKIKGVSDGEFKDMFKVSFFDKYKEAIEKHIRSGLLLKDEDRIYLSSRGIDLSNVVMSEFI